jgi:hypothetical protein
MQIKTKIVSYHTLDFKTVRQEVNSTVILPPLVFPDLSFFVNIRPGHVLSNFYDRYFLRS